MPMLRGRGRQLGPGALQRLDARVRRLGRGSERRSAARSSSRSCTEPGGERGGRRGIGLGPSSRGGAVVLLIVSRLGPGEAGTVGAAWLWFARGRIEDRLAELGLTLPRPVRAAARGRVQVRPRSGRDGPSPTSRAICPIDGAEVLVQGKVGADADGRGGLRGRAPHRALDLRLARSRSSAISTGSRAGSRRSGSSTARPASTSRPP